MLIPIAGCAAIGNLPLFAHDRGERQPDGHKVPRAWRPTALHKTSKGRETERRPGKEKKQVMTTDEIIVGIDDSHSLPRSLRGAAAYLRSTGIVLRALHGVD